MSHFHSSPNFKMTKPMKLGIHDKYTFWLETNQPYLFDYVKTFICVDAVTGLNNTRRLVSIKDEYDADEAWHYIFTELECESSTVVLDEIWENFIRLL
ncbi:MAG: hypothetical protein D6711_10935 [Chloroflexi bacterium]|nr:MAG: hypothetical protein D6711_10935 [Chloroflexota bacterium]